MAYAMTKQGSLDNCVTYEFMCDTVEDMNAIEDRYRTIGTVAIVLQGNSGLEVYIASSDKQWNSFSGAGAGGAGAGLSIHICGQSEVENGLPSVSEPDEATIYLVPASDSSSENLYDEYVYVAEAWEKFGSGGVSNDLPITYEQTVLEFDDVVNADINNPPQNQEEMMAIMKSIVIKDTTKLTNGTGVLQVGDNKYQITIMTDESTIAGMTLDKETGSPTREAVFNIIIEQSELTTNVPAKLIVADANNTPNETYPVRIELGGALYSTVPAFYLQDAQVITENALRDYLGQTLGYYLRNYVTVSNLSKYAPINNPAFTGSISLGRKSDSDIGGSSIATGNNTIASDYCSHAEGDSTTASGYDSHAEGATTIASGNISHAEGENTTASGNRSHAEGWGASSQTKTVDGKTYTGTGAHGSSAHSEGFRTWAIGNYSHAEGEATTASGVSSHAEGGGTTASGPQAHAEGTGATASGQQAHAEGTATNAEGNQSHAEGTATNATNSQAHAEGYYTFAKGAQSHAEGYQTTAKGDYSHSEGYGDAYESKAINGTTYTGTGAHGIRAHSEGNKTWAVNENTHAEGANTIAAGPHSHAEGVFTEAHGHGAHAEGNYAIAKGNHSHAEGNNTIASGQDSHVSGAYNVEDSNNYFAEIVGNGGSASARSNARILDWSGNERLMGDIYVGCNADSTGGAKVATEAYVNARIPTPPTTDGTYTLQVTVSNGEATYSWI